MARAARSIFVIREHIKARDAGFAQLVALFVRQRCATTCSPCRMSCSNGLLRPLQRQDWPSRGQTTKRYVHARAGAMQAKELCSGSPRAQRFMSAAPDSEWAQAVQQDPGRAAGEAQTERGWQRRLIGGICKLAARWQWVLSGL